MKRHGVVKINFKAEECGLFNEMVFEISIDTDDNVYDIEKVGNHFSSRFPELYKKSCLDSGFNQFKQEVNNFVKSFATVGYLNTDGVTNSFYTLCKEVDNIIDFLIEGDVELIEEEDHYSCNSCNVMTTVSFNSEHYNLSNITNERNKKIDLYFAK